MTPNEAVDPTKGSFATLTFTRFSGVFKSTSLRIKRDWANIPAPRHQKTGKNIGHKVSILCNNLNTLTV